MQQRELTTRQAAAFLGLSDASLKRLVAALGGIPLLLLDPAASCFVEMDARLRALVEDYQTRTRSSGAR